MKAIELLERYEAGDFEEATMRFLVSNPLLRRFASGAEELAGVMAKEGEKEMEVAIVYIGNGALMFRSFGELESKIEGHIGAIERGKAFPYALLKKRKKLEKEVRNGRDNDERR